MVRDWEWWIWDIGLDSSSVTACFFNLSDFEWLILATHIELHSEMVVLASPSRIVAVKETQLNASFSSFISKAWLYVELQFAEARKNHSYWSYSLKFLMVVIIVILIFIKKIIILFIFRVSIPTFPFINNSLILWTQAVNRCRVLKCEIFSTIVFLTWVIWGPRFGPALKGMSMKNPMQPNWTKARRQNRVVTNIVFAWNSKKWLVALISSKSTVKLHGCCDETHEKQLYLSSVSSRVIH